MFGKMQLAEFKACELEQEAASAWSILDGLVGATYKPICYLGKQQVHGTLYWFIAEQVLVTHPPIRRVIKLAIHGFNGDYDLLESSIEEIA